ncbi:MAG: hypothetical protein Q7J15_00240 [Candidatus Desulfaltia sp.]|nr:hypothetical protein [Candidatus Desulfaltia sp.]
MTYRIEFIAGEHHQRRGVCFLISGDKKVAAKPIFDNLKGNIDSLLRTRFDAWIDNQLGKPSRYHGWNKSEFHGRYTKCFVFKAKSHRFYGFLCNPKPSNNSYQVCILVRYAFKKEHKTDEADLKQVETLRTTVAVWRAITDYFGRNL